MNKIHFINGSPRKDKGTSGYFIGILTEYLDNFHVHYVDELSFDKFEDDDVIVFVSPVYVDGLPAIMTAFLEEFYEYLQENLCKLTGYCIVNCGFPESEQTKIATTIIKNFCSAVKIDWGGGLGIGAGEFLLNSQALPMKSKIKINLHRNLIGLAGAIDEKSKFGLVYTGPKMPKLLFKIGATSYWYKLAKSNGLTKKQMTEKIAVE